MRFNLGLTNIDTAGTAERVLNTTDRVLWVKFTAPATNADITYVGASNVDAPSDPPVGYPLGAAGGSDSTLELDFRGGSVLANTFWVDAISNNDDVAWAFVLE